MDLINDAEVKTFIQKDFDENKIGLPTEKLKQLKEMSTKERKKAMTDKIFEESYESFKVKKDKKIRRKERRQNNNYKNWTVDDVEDWEEEDEKVDKY